MRISISVRKGFATGAALIDVDENHNDLPLDELVDRYVKPALASALARLKEQGLTQASHDPVVN